MNQVTHIDGWADVKVYHGALCRAEDCTGSFRAQQTGSMLEATSARDRWIARHPHGTHHIHVYTEVRIVTP